MIGRLLVFVLAVVAISSALWQLKMTEAGIRITPRHFGTTPAVVYRPEDDLAHPVVLIAHGFAGSQQLMQTFALTLAGNGYIAVTFDFPGHGRNPQPLTGSISELDGATRTLLDALTQVGNQARTLGDGRLAVLGHSMASDIVVRYAERTPGVAATIAVSMYSPAVTRSAPANLLVIVGDWESMLKGEALRAVSLASAPVVAQAGVTYGNFADGSARRTAFSAHVEHASVLFSQDSMRESLSWLDQSFGVHRDQPPRLPERGPWILLLIAGTVALGWPLARLLPRIDTPGCGAGRAWRELALPIVVPLVATPLILRVVPTHFLPVLVGDYLAAHFLLYGLLTAACLAWQARRREALGRDFGLRLAAQRKALLIAATAVTAYGFLALDWPINTFVTSFWPGPERVGLLLAMMPGTLLFFLADEWLTRGAGAARWAPLVSRFTFLLSLGVAVALDFQRLFFLVIIIPVILLFFLVYGLISRWTYRATGHPWVAGIASAIGFAWAIGVTFPLLAG